MDCSFKGAICFRPLHEIQVMEKDRMVENQPPHGYLHLYGIIATIAGMPVDPVCRVD